MKLVLDTNVLVSALLNPHGSPARVLDALLSGVHTLALDDRILDEYREVLSRSKFGFSEDDIADLLDFIHFASERVSAKPLRLVLADSNDKPFLEVAIEAKAEVLITGNTKDFPRHLKKPRIMSPSEFLKFCVGE